MSLFDLTGKLAVVTGARRGIGLAMAGALAAAGADIIGVSAQLEKHGSDVEKRVRDLGRSFTAHRVDFTDRAAVAAFAHQLEHQGGAVDILVNNAGTIKRAPAAEHSDTDWDEVIEVNLSAQFVLSREIGRHMAERGHGKIIFAASLLSFQGGINVPGYAAAKSGIVGLTRALANEWAAHGINVNAIAPGCIATDNTQALREDPVRYRAILDRIPAAAWSAGTGRWSLWLRPTRGGWTWWPKPSPTCPTPQSTRCLRAPHGGSTASRRTRHAPVRLTHPAAPGAPRRVPEAARRRVWPEVEAMISACNIRNYTIFLRGDWLFGYYEHVGADHAADLSRMAADPATRRWWALTEPCQEQVDGVPSGQWWARMAELWHQD